MISHPLCSSPQRTYRKATFSSNREIPIGGKILSATGAKGFHTREVCRRHEAYEELVSPRFSINTYLLYHLCGLCALCVSRLFICFYISRPLRSSSLRRYPKRNADSSHTWSIFWYTTIPSFSSRSSGWYFGMGSSSCLNCTGEVFLSTRPNATATPYRMASGRGGQPGI